MNEVRNILSDIELSIAKKLKNNQKGEKIR